MTDFGLQDHFVGVMKGVIHEIAPQTDIIDISHQIRPQNVAQAARMLAEAAPYFSTGTVHVAVVDPGVGTKRRAIAAKVGNHFFVAPDNGLLTVLLEQAESAGEPHSSCLSRPTAVLAAKPQPVFPWSRHLLPLSVHIS